MYFRVTSQQLKKSLFHLKSLLVEKTSFVKKFKENKSKEKELEITQTQIQKINKLIKEVEFAVYKTKVKEFSLEYEEAELVRPALLQEDTTQKQGK